MNVHAYFPKIASVVLSLATLATSLPSPAQQTKAAAPTKRNVIIFVADGLRHDSVNVTDSPLMLAVRTFGVHFANSHSLFPTFTTANAASIATGHYLGDTGDFSNTIYEGYPLYESGNFGFAPGTQTPFLENDEVLADFNSNYGGDYLNEETLLQLARKSGYNTASIGKLGPVGIQDVIELQPTSSTLQPTQTVFFDDATGSSAGIPLSDAAAKAAAAAGLPAVAPARTNGCLATDQCSNGFSGNNQTPGTTSPNLVQQKYFADAATKVLPQIFGSDKPFALVFWSRDPDGTQHNQGDSLNKLSPGINGPTSKAAIKNADNNLAELLTYLAGNPAVAANTDLFITSDHGFATISHHEIDAAGDVSKAYPTQFIYKDATGRQEVNTGFLPVGFLALDIAHTLNLPLFDPDNQITDNTGHKVYEPVNPAIAQQTATVRQHPSAGDGLIGGTGAILDKTDAKVIIAANGGSDLIYVPSGDYTTIKRLVKFLTAQDYVGSVFVDDTYGPLPGALKLSDINLFGTSKTPRPTIAVSFKTFYLQQGNLLSAVQIADSSLQEGQGMHGSLGRDNTFNNMAAYGPDFKQGFTDVNPVSNADIARTLADIMGLSLASNGGLRGRVLKEALVGGPTTVKAETLSVVSPADAAKQSTVLHYQKVGNALYFDEACLVATANAAQTACH